MAVFGVQKQNSATTTSAFTGLFLSETCMSALAFLSTWVYQFSPIRQSALIWNRDYVYVSVKKNAIARFDTTHPFQGVLRLGSMQMV